MVANTTPFPVVLRKLTPSFILCDRSDIDRECCANRLYLNVPVCLLEYWDGGRCCLLNKLAGPLIYVKPYFLSMTSTYLVEPGVLGADPCCMCLGSADRVHTSSVCFSVFTFAEGDGGGVPDLTTMSCGWIQRCREFSLFSNCRQGPVT